MKQEPNLQFSLGPVQGFISQARRTRDLWSGSYILSYLSARAMKGIIGCGGKIIVPKVWGDDAKRDLLLTWVMEERSGEPPRIGTIPNRFQALAEDPKEAAKAAELQIRDGWKCIESAVWEEYVSCVSANGKGTKDIWDRQVKDFWEIYWTVGNLPNIEARKNWRTKLNWNRKLPEHEIGDHCTVMGEWQELSGFTRSKGQAERSKQDEFWESLRGVRGVGRLDFGEDERLCSIAMIKRMFPKVAKKAIGWNIDADRWPSTLYVSALPWLKDIEKRNIKLARSYADLVLKAADERAVRRKGVWAQVGGPENPDLIDFLELDGNFYFKSSVENPRHTPLKGTPLGWNSKEPEGVRATRQGLLDQLEKLYKEVGSKPSPFYGILLMDGDSMGELLVNHGEEVSIALAEFSSQVDSKVKEHGGVTVYAGGDDVLAMLPVTNAIGCAVELSICFEEAFKKAFENINAEPRPRGTISAGIVMAHGRYPLRSVLQEAHHILDDVAKEENGRESLAVSVMKGGGRYCLWTSTWPSLKRGESTVLDKLAEALTGEEKHFSTSFFFRVREILTLLSPQPFWQPGCYIRLPEEFQEDDILDLLTAEYLKSKSGNVSVDLARPKVADLLSVSYRRFRNRELEYETDRRCLSADGAMLVKFLAEGGMED